MARLATRLTERFGIEHPILSAPMALAAGGALASPAGPRHAACRRDRLSTGVSPGLQIVDITAAAASNAPG